MPDFSTRLKELRKNKKNTQQDLANILDLKRNNIAKWETGKATPDFEIIQKIADYFEVNVNYLLGTSNEKESLIRGLENKDSIYLIIYVALKKHISIPIIEKAIQAIELPQSMKDELYFILEMIDSNERQLRWWEANKNGSTLKATNEN